MGASVLAVTAPVAAELSPGQTVFVASLGPVALLLGVIFTSLLTRQRDQQASAREDSAMLWSIVHKHGKTAWGKDETGRGVPAAGYQAMVRLIANPEAASEQADAARKLLAAPLGMPLEDAEALERQLSGSGPTRIGLEEPSGSEDKTGSDQAAPLLIYPRLAPLTAVLALGLTASFYVSGSFDFGQRQWELAAKVLLAFAAVLATPALLGNRGVFAAAQKGRTVGSVLIWLAFVASVALTLGALFGHEIGLAEGPDRRLAATGILCALAVLSVMLFVTQVSWFARVTRASEPRIAARLFSWPAAGFVFIAAVVLDFGAAYV